MNCARTLSAAMLANFCWRHPLSWSRRRLTTRACTDSSSVISRYPFFSCVYGKRHLKCARCGLGIGTYFFRLSHKKLAKKTSFYDVVMQSFFSPRPLRLSFFRSQLFAVPIIRRESVARSYRPLDG